jgi:hypothetical protein
MILSDENIFDEYKRVAMAIEKIHVTDDELILEWKYEKKEKDVYLFKDLKKATIITTDRGPFEEDVFWLLLFKIIIMIPQGAGTDKLLERLQKFPGFDNDNVIKAMTCSENDSFLVWEKKK